MTGTNHALAGAIIALAVKEPVLALPLALASHFALDTLPHFGMDWNARRKEPALFKWSLAADLSLLVLGLALLLLHGAPLVLYACSIIAISPDFAWFYRFVVKEKNGSKKPPPMNAFNRWHANIQTLESVRPGLYIEIVFLIIFSGFFVSFAL